MQIPRLPARKHPAKGVHSDIGGTIVLLTVCTAQRSPWLANETAHALLRDSWREANHWIVGRYIIMPDHLHLFAAPGARPEAFDAWVTYWKRQFTRRYATPSARWQSGCFHHRIRNGESYSEKWQYVRENAVRAGLVARWEDWPFAGEIAVLGLS